MIGPKRPGGTSPSSGSGTLSQSSTRVDRLRGTSTTESGEVTRNSDGSLTWHYRRENTQGNGKPNVEEWTVTTAPTPSPSPSPKPPPVSPQPAPTQQVQVAKATHTHVNGLVVSANDFPTGKPIPCQYGQVEAFPDLAAMPYTEVVGEFAVLHLLYCMGQGEFDFVTSTARINGLAIDGLDGVTVEVVPPGSSPTLYPTTVIPQELTQTLTTAFGTVVVVNAPTTLISRIAVEISFPQGLFGVDTSGNLVDATVTVIAEYQPIDDDGLGIGSIVSTTTTFTQATQNAFFESISGDVPPGRYHVQVKRTVAEAGGTTRDKAIFSKLSGYHVAHPDYGNVTLIGVQVITSRDAQLSNIPKLSVVCIRKLPIWSGSAWSAPTATRSIIWALVDVVKASYGGLLPDAVLDLPALLALDATLAARGDYFDVRMSEQVSIKDMIKTICATGRLLDFIHGGKLTVVRDQAPTEYVQLFTPLNIIAGSFAVSYQPPQPSDEDAFNVEYVDVGKGVTAQVTATLSTAAKPKTVKLVGCTSRAQAWREGMFWRASKVYRRVHVAFATSLEGAMLRPGDNILLAHDFLSWGQWGEIYQVDGTKLYLSNPLDFSSASSGTLYLRDVTGKPSAGFTVTADVNPYIVHFTSLPSMTIHSVASDSSAQRTYYAFDNGSSRVHDCKVLSVSLKNPMEYQIQAVVDDSRCYTADTGSVPTVTAAFALTYDASTVYGGQGGFSNGGAGSAGVGILRFSDLVVFKSTGGQYQAFWTGAGYSGYVVYVQWIGQSNWSRLAVTSGSNFTFNQANSIDANAVKIIPVIAGIEQSSKALTVSTTAFIAV